MPGASKGTCGLPVRGPESLRDLHADSDGNPSDRVGGLPFHSYLSAGDEKLLVEGAVRTKVVQNVKEFWQL